MGGGQPTAITPSEAHVGKEFDILNVPRVHGKLAVIIVHVLVICSNLIKIIANVTKKHIYSQTCIMRSPFGNGLLTAWYRLTV